MIGNPAQAPDAAVQWLSRHSIGILRVCLGVVFLIFGALKLQPGLSPVEPLVERTVRTLTLGIVSGHAAVLLTAELELCIGFTLTFGYFLRVGLAMLAVALVGILSPLVLFPSELFHGGVTLEAQYVFKDIVLAASGLVIAAHTLGARLVPPAEHDAGPRPPVPSDTAPDWGPDRSTPVMVDSW